MASKYEIRHYEVTDKQEVLALVSKIWGAKVEKNLKSQWDWKYHNHPQWEENHSQVYVMTFESKIIGIFGLMPARIQNSGQTFYPVFGTDFGIHPDYRGAAGIRFLKYIMQTKKTLIGVPTERAYLFEKKLGFMDAARFNDYVAIIDLKKFLLSRSHKLATAVLIDAIYNMVFPLFRAFFKVNVRNQLVWAKANKIDERFNTFWNSIASGYEDIITIRDQQFLKWRCEQVPNRSYEIFIAEYQNKIKGYIILSFKQSNTIKQGIVVDFLVERDDKKTLAFLLQHAMQVFIKNKVTVVKTSMTSNHGWCDTALKKSGFLVKTDGAFVDIFDVDKSRQKTLAAKKWYTTLIDSDSEVTE